MSEPDNRVGPAAIVVCVSSDAYRIALLVGAEQTDGNPTVLLYSFAPGLPYRSASAAVDDATLILKRSEP